MAGGYVVKPSNGWYQKVGVEKKYRASELNAEFWEDIFATTDFEEFIQQVYMIGHKSSVELDIENELE